LIEKIYNLIPNGIEIILVAASEIDGTLIARRSANLSIAGLPQEEYGLVHNYRLSSIQLSILWTNHLD
jgi:hypothetical protein